MIARRKGGQTVKNVCLKTSYHFLIKSWNQPNFRPNLVKAQEYCYYVQELERQYGTLVYTGLADDVWITEAQNIATQHFYPTIIPCMRLSDSMSA